MKPEAEKHDKFDDSEWQRFPSDWAERTSVGKSASKINENFEMKRVSIVERETKFVY